MEELRRRIVSFASRSPSQNSLGSTEEQQSPPLSQREPDSSVSAPKLTISSEDLASTELASAAAEQATAFAAPTFEAASAAVNFSSEQPPIAKADEFHDADLDDVDDIDPPLSVRAPVSVDHDDGESDVSYNSALDRGAGSVTGSVESSQVPYEPVASGFDTSGLAGRDEALRRLNAMASGRAIASTDILNGVNESDLKSFVGEIAREQNLDPESPAVSSLVEQLIPVVNATPTQAAEGSTSVQDVSMPRATISAEHEDVAEDDVEGDDTEVDDEEEDNAPGTPTTAEGLRVRDEDYVPRPEPHGEAQDDEGDEWESEEGENAEEEEEEEEEEEDVEDDDDEGVENHGGLEALMRAASAAAAEAGSQGQPRFLGAGGPSLPSLPPRRPASGGRAPAVTSSTAGADTQASAPAVQAVAAPGQPQASANGEVDETREKLMAIRVKLLRLALRLGQSPRNVVVAQVLYRLGLAEQLRSGQRAAGGVNPDQASALAEQQESAGGPELDFTCTIMVLGKTGVGKSATINALFDERKAGVDAFEPSTKEVRIIEGTVAGIKVRIIDTPGLHPSAVDASRNEKIVRKIHRFSKKHQPDIVLYFDRLDMQSSDFGDLPLLRTITEGFGAAVWFNAIVVLTHAASAPPDGSNGQPVSYEMYVAQRSHVVQQTIRQAAGDMRLLNPVSLAENHPACRTNRTGQHVLPNGQVWKPQLLLLCFASKILGEANSLLKLQESPAGRGRTAGAARQRVLPLPYLLSQLLQARQQMRLPDDQLAEEDDLDELEEEDQDDDEVDYDQLPPFKTLSRDELSLLTDSQRRAYYEELADRERLFMKKQWRDELQRRREARRLAADRPSATPAPAVEEEPEVDQGNPMPGPEVQIPPSFDGDNPSYRYRYLESNSQWRIQPIVESHGWDHDAGLDGFNLEKSFAFAGKVPAGIMGQITKDKRDGNIALEAAASWKHGSEGGSPVTTGGLDIQTVGSKDIGMAYTLRSETCFPNVKNNKTTAGIALTLMGNAVAAGLKIQDNLTLLRRLNLVVSGGIIGGKGNVAKGGSLEATWRHKDYLIDQSASQLGLSIMDWHGDLALGGNVSSQFTMNRTVVVTRANLNNRGAGQINVRLSSNDHLQIALVGLVPMLRYIFLTRFARIEEM